MASIHFLNVGPGDCTIIEHDSGRVTMLDICCGNAPRQGRTSTMLSEIFGKLAAGSNFRMCDRKTQPLDYLDRLNVDEIWRFVLSHPDMDHMDGLATLLDEKRVVNFWDSGVRRTAPDFSNQARFQAHDWEAYQQLIKRSALSGGQAVTTINPLAGSRFTCANEPQGNHDGLYILAPDAALRDKATASPDVNDGSYAILYQSTGGRIVLPGDAYDETWNHVLEHHARDVAGCAFLLAPHHGRDSDRSYEFLDILRPSLTLIGCAPSEHIHYEAWTSRGLDYITSNQAGNVVLRTNGQGLDVLVENAHFASKKIDLRITERDVLGNYRIGWIQDGA